MSHPGGIPAHTTLLGVCAAMCLAKDALQYVLCEHSSPLVQPDVTSAW